MDGSSRSGSAGSSPDPNEVRLFQDGTRFRTSPWTIEELIGFGASGQVYRVRHDQLGHFALKASVVRISGRTQEIRRALAGAKANYQLEHPNVVRVWDLNWEDDGLLWVRMELLSGQTVADVIRQTGALPALYALDVALEVACGLQAIHEHGIIHRDVKPSNLILTTDGVVKLFDFAYAKVSGSGVRTTDQGGRALGSLPYMAPEHLGGAEPTVLFDVHALGVTLWEMLVGVHPLDNCGRDLTAAFTRKMKEPVPSLVATARLPVYVDAFVQRATAREPAKRHSSIWAFLQEGEEVRDRLAKDRDPHVRAIVSTVPRWASDHPVRRQRSGRSENSEAAPVTSRPGTTPPSRRVVVRVPEASAQLRVVPQTLVMPAAGEARVLHAPAATIEMPAAGDAAVPAPPGAAERAGAAPSSATPAIASNASVAASRNQAARGARAPSDPIALTTDEPVAERSRPPADTPARRLRLAPAVAVAAAVVAAAIGAGVLVAANGRAPGASDAPASSSRGTAPASASPSTRAGTNADATRNPSGATSASGAPSSFQPRPPRTKPGQPRVGPAPTSLPGVRR